jgi:hypothetical protein
MAADSAVEKMLRKTSESDMNEGACLCLFDSKVRSVAFLGSSHTTFRPVTTLKDSVFLS